MLRAIFYARFHPERGPSVLHQYPLHHITSSDGGSGEGFFSFSDVSSYVFPPYEVCNRALAISTNGFHLLGFPVSLEDAKYARNRFTFNVCFILDHDTDTGPWGLIVRKTAHFFQAMEQEDGLLQSEENLEASRRTSPDAPPPSQPGKIDALLARIMQDLNTYGETCARVNDVHVLNLRLTSSRSNPPKAQAWHVPLLIRHLPDPNLRTWDLTLQRIQSHIDGIKHIQRIAELADVEVPLVQKAVRELLYHQHVVLLDIVHFQAIYATTDAFSFFVRDETMLSECCEYIATAQPSSLMSPTTTHSTSAPTASTVILLYRLLATGLTLQDLYTSNQSEFANIDARRFVTFGILKGFLRRIQRYALAVESQSNTPRIPNGASLTKSGSSLSDTDQAWKIAARSSGWPTPPVPDHSDVPSRDGGGEGLDQDERLRDFLDGNHCLDEVCVRLHLSEKQLMERLHGGRFGDVMLLCK